MPGLLSQSILTAPSVYFAMADDKLFFRHVARIDARTQAGVAAIVMQGVLASVIVFFRNFGQIVDYVVSADFIAYGLTATCLFVFRRRDQSSGPRLTNDYRAPGHPFTTLFFTFVCSAVVAGTVYSYPRNTVIVLGI